MITINRLKRIIKEEIDDLKWELEGGEKRLDPLSNDELNDKFWGHLSKQNTKPNKKTNKTMNWNFYFIKYGFKDDLNNAEFIIRDSNNKPNPFYEMQSAIQEASRLKSNNKGKILLIVGS